MKYINLEMFSDFKCIGTDCPSTCCSAGWRIIIDPLTDEYYKTVRGEIGERLEKYISRKMGLSYFGLNDGKRCPFLNNEQLCDIYIYLGEEHMCDTCKAYPRYTFISGDIVFSGVSISCPEVARVFLSQKNRIQFDFTEDENTINNENEVDWDVFNHSIRAFSSAIEIAQNRELSVRERNGTVILFLFQYQTYIDERRNPSGLIDLFSDVNTYSRIMNGTAIHQKDLQSKADFCIELMEFSRKIVELKMTIPELYDLISYYEQNGNITMQIDRWMEAYRFFEESDEQIWQEQILVYILHRYFMQGVETRDFYSGFITGFLLILQAYKAVIVLYYLRWNKIPEYDEQILMVSHVSRLVEHSDDFRHIAKDHFFGKGMSDPAFLFRLIS